MHSITNSKGTRNEPRPTMNGRARQSTIAPKPDRSGLSQEELRALVLEMIG